MPTSHRRMSSLPEKSWLRYPDTRSSREKATRSAATPGADRILAGRSANRSATGTKSERPRFTSPGVLTLITCSRESYARIFASIAVHSRRLLYAIIPAPNAATRIRANHAIASPITPKPAPVYGICLRDTDAVEPTT